MRERNTGYVLLGVIAQMGQASGYEAQRFIAESIGNFWRESFGQIYPELNRLAAEGLIAATADAEGPGRGRTRYKVTARGRRLLTEWLDRPAQEQPPRQEVILKVFFGAIGGEDMVRAQLDAEEARQHQRLLALDGLGEMLVRDYASDPDLPYSLMSVRAGQRAAQARLAWVEECRQLLAAAGRGPQRVVGAWRRLVAAEVGA